MHDSTISYTEHQRLLYLKDHEISGLRILVGNCANAFHLLGHEMADACYCALGEKKPDKPITFDQTDHYAMEGLNQR